MKRIIITLAAFASICSAHLLAQTTMMLTGRVISENNEPIEGAVVTVQRTRNTTTREDGAFVFELKNKADKVSVWAPGYYPVQQYVNDREEIIVMLVADDKYKYNSLAVLPFRKDMTLTDDYTSAINIAKKDFIPGSSKIDKALASQIAGLQVKKGSGMPGEGSFFNLRGIRSLIGDNAPLIVIDGAPYIPDKNESRLIGGYTRDIFQAFNIQDIQNITVLKGAEASIYGSMGSNGVILIETDGAASNDLETRVSYYGQFGVNWSDKRIPLLKGTDYTSYLSDAAMTYYSDMNSMFSAFPFLKDPNNPKNYYLYNNSTDWQDLIYNNGFTTDNLFRVEGGDAIAKYDLSVGYMNDAGIINNTKQERYHARLNTNVLVSDKVDIAFSVGLAYLNANVQEQGINRSTNPLLAAYAQSPVLSAYQKDRDNNVLKSYSNYYFGDNTNMNFAVSNPLAIVNTLDARTRQYDLDMRAAITYRPLRDITLTGSFGMYYNYDNEHLFVPGVSQKTIIPISDAYGTANNLVRDGVAESLNLYYNFNARYTKIFNSDHRFSLYGGLQVITTTNEYDAGEGRNTANDFYQTLGNTDALGRRFYGYQNNWNWINMYAHADYTFRDLIQAGLNIAYDAASSTGADADRFYAYPSVSIVWLGKGMSSIQNSTLINKLNVRAEYGLTGNTRFASSMGKFYYQSAPYDKISSIARVNIPNTYLRPETNESLNIGFDISVLHNRLSVSVDLYDNVISNMICVLPISSIYGTSPYYDNIGDMKNRGAELSVMASLIRTRNFEWIVGGNISKYKNEIKSLGGVDKIIQDGIDGLQFITEVGKSPYHFYGFKTNGVYSTQAEADAADLTNPYGGKYQAGDIRFIDQNNDGKINSADRVSLGSASPDYFGGFYTNIKYKGFAISAEFAYSKGNMAYNASRRETESMCTLGNQSEAVLNRWILEGQVTDIPRASYGDKSGNAIFSDRWIEDASYVKMKNITFSYSFNKTVLNFFRSGSLYVTGENLLTFTKYLGLDPEFSYSYSDMMQGVDYAKVIQPKSVKLGVNLKF